MDEQPSDRYPEAKGNGSTERKGCKISVSFRARGLWGSGEGCQIRYQHIKTSLRGWNRQGMTWSVGQNKKHTYTGPHTQSNNAHNPARSIYCNDAKLTHRLPALSFLSPLHTHRDSHPHTHWENTRRSADITFSTYPYHASVRNHITSATPIRKKHNEAARSTLSKVWESHYAAPQGCVVPVQENNQRSTHPSTQREGRRPFPIFPPIWDGNELLWKTGEGEVEEQTTREWEERRNDEEYGI